MKNIRKNIVIDSESIDSIRLEKFIMLSVDHPFIISMEYVFQTEYRIYFMMDFIKGGELYQILAEKKFLSEEEAKFYVVQITAAIGYLHKSKIIYRDLKPENILIDEDGYIKLADFGLAKIIDEKMTNSFCGTPEYLSPEMISGTGHDHTIDWWTLGILLYEMLVGIPPFYNKNQSMMYQLIQGAPLKFPQMDKHGFEISKESQDLISNLLIKDKTQRLGKDNDSEEILNHPWFNGIDVAKIL